ncbi:conserved hypothetical protein [Desulfosarcina cetonica]|uniref:helix-turn-helix domain-containing protein n=1 Tax=Desulfosarcina cetonica TaxID=90730 RepID=UPI001BBFE255|nr:helix-turn-helix domain-containing protein [Desulfosarcina cetonica]VTR66055.1 conserved hypothetical protein [Desulfosarcina cetonica]
MGIKSVAGFIFPSSSIKVSPSTILQSHTESNFPKNNCHLFSSDFGNRNKAAIQSLEGGGGQSKAAAEEKDRPMDCESNDPKNKEINQMAANGCAQTVPGKRLNTIKELTMEFGGTEWFWRSQIWDGQLPYVQVGRKMFIDRLDLEKFIQDNKLSN